MELDTLRLRLVNAEEKVLRCHGTPEEIARAAESNDGRIAVLDAIAKRMPDLQFVTDRLREVRQRLGELYMVESVLASIKQDMISRN